MSEGPKLVSLPERNEGNGARELLIEYFDGEHYLRHALLDRTAPNLGKTDHLLSWLWARGFKVVPLGGTDSIPSPTNYPTDEDLIEFWREWPTLQPNPHPDHVPGGHEYAIAYLRDFIEKFSLGYKL